MHEAVSDILVERSREPDRVNQMVLISLLAHAVIFTGLAIMPSSWRLSHKATVTPMMITLSGGNGPDTGGLNPISARPVQEIAPTTKAAPVVPPASKAPEMVAPEPKATPAAKTPPKIEKPLEKSTARKPTTGPEPKTGSARAETGGQPIPFGGLTRAAGSSSTGTAAMTDYANFCCPDYLAQMVDLIKRNWNQNLGAAGQVRVKFTIHRDGAITDVKLDQPSGISLLDLESQRAVAKTRALPPLPREFSENTLTVTVIFDYHR